LQVNQTLLETLLPLFVALIIAIADIVALNIAIAAMATFLYSLRLPCHCR